MCLERKRSRMSSWIYLLATNLGKYLFSERNVYGSKYFRKMQFLSDMIFLGLQ